MEQFEVIVGAGSLRATGAGAVTFPHRWTDAGVTVETAFTGAHLLPLAVAGCVLNDVYREAAELGIGVDGVRVSAVGGFDTDAWAATTISYAVTVDSSAVPERLDALLRRVDDVAEIPRALQHGASVQRVEASDGPD